MKASTRASKIHARAEVEGLALKAFSIWSSVDAGVNPALGALRDDHWLKDQKYGPFCIFSV